MKPKWKSERTKLGAAVGDPPSLALYGEQLRFFGRVRARAGSWDAFDASDVKIGTFANRDDAKAAVKRKAGVLRGSAR